MTDESTVVEATRRAQKAEQERDEARESVRLVGGFFLAMMDGEPWVFEAHPGSTGPYVEPPSSEPLYPAKAPLSEHKTALAALGVAEQERDEAEAALARVKALTADRLILQAKLLLAIIDSPHARTWQAPVSEQPKERQ